MSQTNLTEEPVLDQVRQGKAREYAELGRRLVISEAALIGALLVFLVFSGLSRRLAMVFALPTVPAAALYLTALIAAYGVLSAPLSYYRGFVLPRRYGLSIQRFSDWLVDQIKAKGLGLTLSAGMVAVAYWFISAFPEIWWLLSWSVIVLLSLILTALTPIIIVPLFFRMKPLADTELRLKLEQLAQRAKTSVRGVYTLELSQKATTANAALMGLGNTRRIVLSDTLLQHYSAPEIKVIVAHELGHHRHGDIPRSFVVQSAIWLVGLYIVDLVLRAGVTALGFSGISDIAALPLLVLVLAAFSLLITPLLNTYHRKLEVAADGYAMELTDNPQSFIVAMSKLTDQNLAEAQPGRWVELVMHDHPSYSKRVEHAHYYSAHRLTQQSEGR